MVIVDLRSSVRWLALASSYVSFRWVHRGALVAVVASVLAACSGAGTTKEENLVQAWVEAERAYFGRDFETAKSLYRELLIKIPDHADAHLRLGNIAYYQDRDRDAIEHYFLALQGEPKLAKAHHNLAQALMRLGRSHLAEYRRLEPGQASDVRVEE